MLLLMGELRDLVEFNGSEQLPRDWKVKIVLKQLVPPKLQK